MKRTKLLICTILAMLILSVFTVCAFAEEMPEPEISITQIGEFVPGEEVTFEVRLSQTLSVKSGAIAVDYDLDKVEVISYKWHIPGALITIFDPATGKGAFAALSPVSMGDLIFTIKFRVKEDVNVDDLDFTFGVDAKDPDTDEDIFISCGNHRSGGAATCTENEVCTICDYIITPAYGHDFSGDLVFDDDYHWIECANGCGETEAPVAHTPGAPADCTNAQTCTDCGFVYEEAWGHNTNGEWISDGNNHWKECANGCQQMADLAAHTPGAPADCNNSQNCTVCDRLLVDALDHDFSGDWITDGDNHWKECLNGCGEKEGFAAHTPGAAADCINSQNCTVCNKVLADAIGHNADVEWTSDNDNHWHECLNGCGIKLDLGAHTPGANASCTESKFCPTCNKVFEDAIGHNFDGEWIFDGENHWKECANGCGEIAYKTAHNPSDEWTSDGTNHWHECTDGCGVKLDISTHTPGADASCTEDQICVICNHVFVTATGHNFSSEWVSDGENHWHVCRNNCGEKSQVTAHTPGTSASCTEDQSCTVCNYVIEEALGHRVSEDWVSDGDNHWHVCLNGCGMNVDLMAHLPGAPATCSSTQNCLICNHVLAPLTDHVFSNEWTSDGEKHWHECIGGCGTKSDVTYHTPGDFADCTNDQICTVCDHVLVEAWGHSANGVWINDGENHWHICLNGCDEKLDFAAHNYNGDASCTEDKFCTVCNYIDTPALGHDFSGDWVSNENNHWHTCVNGCGKKIDIAAHTLGDAANCTDPQTCTVCGHIIVPATGHDFRGEWISDGENHWHECLHGCGAIADKVAHTPGDAADCTNSQNCTVCDRVLADATGHNFSDEWSTDGENHWHDCLNGCGEVADKAAHIPGDEANCTDTQNCTVCDKVLSLALGHDFSGEWEYSEQIHYHECLNGCGEIHDIEFHTPGDEANCTDAQICTVCEYVIVEATGHNFSGEWSSDVNGHWHDCLNGCGEVADEADHIIDGEPNCLLTQNCEACGFLVSDAIGHNFSDELSFDGEGHWYACLNGCGTKGEYEEHHLTDPASCTEDQICTVCNQIIEAAFGHNFSDEWTTDGENHWHACLNDCGAKLGFEEHIPGDAATCTEDQLCTVCNAVVAEATGHDFSGEWFTDGENHWNECANGCGLESDRAAHIPGDPATCTDDQVCTVCAYVLDEAYGHTLNSDYFEYDDNHIHVCETCGKYAHLSMVPDCVQDRYCAACDRIIVRHTGHNFSDEIIFDEEGHWNPCLNGCDEKGNYEAHIPGDEATCTEDQLCTVCNAVLAEAIGHNFGGEWISEGENHWHECLNGCGATGDREAHTPGDAATCTENQICTVCNRILAYATRHDFSGEWISDGENHWHECLNGCGEIGDKAAHVPGEEANCINSQNCTVCNYVLVEIGDHRFGGEWITDGENHWHECLNGCGEIGDKAAHVPGDKATCTDSQNCTVCNYIIKEATGHKIGNKWMSDGVNHWHECSNGCGEIADKAAHIPGDPATCTDDQKCTACMYVMNKATGHEFNKYVDDNNASCEANGTKTATCIHPGCSKTDTVEIKGTKLDHVFNEKSGLCENCHVKNPKQPDDKKVTKTAIGVTAAVIVVVLVIVAIPKKSNLPAPKNPIKESDTPKAPEQDSAPANEAAPAQETAQQENVENANPEE